jgi:antitoxin component YwqK of YwqJK toxin-antitoxin module
MIEVKKHYYDNGNIHYEAYYLNGKPHREDGPAFIGYYQNGNIYYKSYYLNGRYHREDGPAYIEYDYYGNVRSKEYYLNGDHLSEQEWFNELSIENKVRFAFGVNND